MPGQGKRPISVKQIDELAEKLRNRATLLSKLARRMESKGLKSIEVMNLPTAGYWVGSVLLS